LHGLEPKVLLVDFIVDLQDIIWMRQVHTFEYFRARSGESLDDSDDEWSLEVGAGGKLGPILATTELVEEALVGSIALQVKSIEGFRLDMQLLIGVGDDCEYR